MPTELAQWITPAIFILGFLYLDRSIRNVRAESRQDMKDLRVEIGNLRDRMDAQNEALCNRMDAQNEALCNRMDAQHEALRDRMDAQNEALRDRMGRIEGTLDVLRDFFVHNGRGTAA